MLLHLAHHAHQGHHLGSVVATFLLATAAATGIGVSQGSEPAARVSVTHVAPEPTATAPTAATGDTDPAGGQHLGVTVPTRDEILAQCAAAGLTAECVSAGLH
jgi:hypothetical protein